MVTVTEIGGGEPLENIYIALDIKKSGDRIGIDSILSLGACVVTKREYTPVQKLQLGYSFYVEIEPTSLDSVPRIIADDASKLVSLSPMWKKPLYCSRHAVFDSRETLRYLQDSEDTLAPGTAMRKLKRWVQNVSRYKALVGIMDASDAGFLNYYCTRHGGFDPLFEHTSIDLRSFWAGATGNPAANLRTARNPGDRPNAHHAGYDAHDLAETARVVLFEKLVHRT